MTCCARSWTLGAWPTWMRHRSCHSVRARPSPSRSPAAPRIAGVHARRTRHVAGRPGPQNGHRQSNRERFGRRQTAVHGRTHAPHRRSRRPAGYDVHDEGGVKRRVTSRRVFQARRPPRWKFPDEAPRPTRSRNRNAALGRLQRFVQHAYAGPGGPAHVRYSGTAHPDAKRRGS